MMGQQEILDALKELGGVATSAQINQKVRQTRNNVIVLLNTLVKHGEVKRIKHGVYQLVEEDSK